MSYSTTVSPSPRDLVARLSDEECVAIDLLLQDGHEDPRLIALVPDEKRRGYLGTLAAQLRALGFTLSESPDLDARVQEWRRSEEAWRREIAAREEARRREAEEQAEEQRRRDAALPPEARRAVQRRRRRQDRRQRRVR